MLKKFFMSEIVAAIKRHALTTIGGFLLAKGFADNQQMVAVGNGVAAIQNNWQSIAGAGVAIIGILQSIAHKVKTAATTAAAATVLAFGLFCGGHAQAQTNAPVLLSLTNAPNITLPLLSLGVSSNTAATANDVLTWITPLLPELTNKTVTLTLDGAYASGGHFGAIGDLEVPIPGATNYLSMGVGLGYIADEWYVAPVSVKLGTTLSIPVIGQVYTFAESGLSLRLSDQAMGNQSLAGAAKTWDVNSNISFTLDGGYGVLTQSGAKNFGFGGVRFNIKW